jgi:uncharacterized damage-inducible protein DinB
VKNVLFALCFLVASAIATPTRAQSAPAGIWEGYAGEWDHVSKQLVELADAIPADKYSWRPAPGVRSVSEAFMHIAISNFYLLSQTGVGKLPAALEPDDAESKITSKPEVIDWLKKSLEAVKTARAKETPAALAPRDGIYLRIIIHANEHMGQLIAYARMNGVVPPWSK